uniref:Serpentine receptor class gamma n=1 Tax=Panagrellus redivivus TaxID=6233 RepID=A0A7E4WCZ8_PANRE
MSAFDGPYEQVYPIWRDALISTQYSFGATVLVLSCFCYIKRKKDELDENQWTATAEYRKYALTASVVSTFHALFMTGVDIFTKLFQKDIQYNAYVLFFTSFFQIVVQNGLSIALFFHTLDQVMLIIVGIWYTNRCQKFVAIITSFINVCYITGISLYVAPSIFPKSSDTECVTPSCQIFFNRGQILLDQRFLTALINTFMGLAFIGLTKLHERRQTLQVFREAQARHVHSVMLNYFNLFEFLFNVVPFSTGYYLFMVHEINLSSIIGQYNMFFSALQALFIGMVYKWPPSIHKNDIPYTVSLRQDSLSMPVRIV